MVVKYRNTICICPLHRISPFKGGLHRQAIQTEHGPYTVCIAERTQKAVCIVKCLWSVSGSSFKNECGSMWILNRIRIRNTDSILNTISMALLCSIPYRPGRANLILSYYALEDELPGCHTRHINCLTRHIEHSTVHTHPIWKSGSWAKGWGTMRRHRDIKWRQHVVFALVLAWG
jgi:hypothetical protein